MDTRELRVELDLAFQDREQRLEAEWDALTSKDHEHLAKIYAGAQAESNHVHQALRRLVDDVERWRTHINDHRIEAIEHAGQRIIPIILREIRDYTYGAKEE